ncbi:MAG: serine/threonine protein kinase [Betaproteobacteria bacterium]
MNDAVPPPYADLTPDRVLDALAAVGFDGDGRFIALNSYENRVYMIYRDDAPPLVAKFYRPGRWSDGAIHEEHEFTAELAGHEIPVVAPLRHADGTTLHHYESHRFAVYPRCPGRAPDLESRDVLQWMGRFIGRIHALGATRAYALRPPIDVQSFGIESRDFVFRNNFIPADLIDAYRAVVDMAIAGARKAFADAGPVGTLRLHGDCHAGNVLWSDDGPHFVDFDDSRMGPAIQDLWMMLAGDRPTMERQLGEVLSGYEDFAEFDDRELVLLEALRTLRLIHYSAWLARRWDDPAFPAAFPWFNTQRYWQDRILELKEQVAAMDEPPLRPS